jgi:initiation factor 1A
MSNKSSKSFKKGSKLGENMERNLYEKKDGEEIGVVTKTLGGSFFLVNLISENREVKARLCGKFKKSKKNNWVCQGKIVAVGIRDFQDNVVDITYIYTDSEVKQLKKKNIITENHVLPDIQENNDIGFDFNDI